MDPKHTKPLSSWRHGWGPFSRGPISSQTECLRVHHPMATQVLPLVLRTNRKKSLRNTKTWRVYPTKPEETWGSKRYYKRPGRLLSSPLDFSKVKLDLNSFYLCNQTEKKRETESLSVSVWWLVPCVLEEEEEEEGQKNNQETLHSRMPKSPLYCRNIHWGAQCELWGRETQQSLKKFLCSRDFCRCTRSSVAY